jgi:hypothetical protein
MRRRFLNTIAFTAAATLGGCVAEDYSDCLDVRLLIRTDHEVRYNSPAGGRTTRSAVGEWYNCIDAVRVYLFDETLGYVKAWDGPALTWNGDYEVPLRLIDLPEGIYTFVAWTNPDELYRSNAHELGVGAHLDGFLMHTDIPADGEMVDDFTHRHHGILERVYVSNNSILDPRTNTIVIDPTVHKVNFTVSGLEATEGGWSLSVADSNRTHDFRNRPVEDDQPYRHTHLLDFGEQGGTRAGTLSAATSMTLQQLHDPTPTTVSLTDMSTGELFYQADLVELIEQVYGVVAGRSVDFERMLEFAVALNFTEGSLFSITVNGWTYRLNTGELW